MQANRKSESVASETRPSSLLLGIALMGSLLLVSCASDGTEETPAQASLESAEDHPFYGVFRSESYSGFGEEEGLTLVLNRLEDGAELTSAETCTTDNVGEGEPSSFVEVEIGEGPVEGVAVNTVAFYVFLERTDGTVCFADRNSAQKSNSELILGQDVVVLGGNSYGFTYDEEAGTVTLNLNKESGLFGAELGSVAGTEKENFFDSADLSGWIQGQWVSKGTSKGSTLSYDSESKKLLYTAFHHIGGMGEEHGFGVLGSLPGDGANCHIAFESTSPVMTSLELVFQNPVWSLVSHEDNDAACESYVEVHNKVSSQKGHEERMPYKKTPLGGESDLLTELSLRPGETLVRAEE